MKKFLSLLLAVCMILSLAACGKNKDQEDDLNAGVVSQAPDTSGDLDEVAGDQSEEPVGNLGDEDRVVVDTPEPDTSIVDPDENQEDPNTTDEPDTSETPDEEAGLGEGDGEEETPEEPDKSKLDAEAGEKAIFEGRFEGGATEQAIREMLHVDGSQVSYEVMQEVIVLLTDYSEQGIERFIDENNRFSGLSQDTQNAAVIVWRILGKEPDEIWEKEFMQKRMVEVIWEVLDSAEETYQRQQEELKKGK